MPSAPEHYRDHLGPIYSWMVGDAGAAMARNRAELEALGLRPGSTGLAVDLGAGPGLHALPLAQLGFSVVAVDSCATLNAELRAAAGGLPIRVVEDDLLRFRAHCSGPADAILCMGDTLTHLPALAAVDRLLGEIADALAPGGAFVTSFRDYVAPEATGSARFILVRADPDRILTCFLEYAGATVLVHDLVHERGAAGWRLSVSSYPKLRLDPQAVVARLASAGLLVHRDSGPGGMARIVARRPAGRAGDAAVGPRRAPRPRSAPRR
jgi:SAM-dependent methyltransferase